MDDLTSGENKIGTIESAKKIIKFGIENESRKTSEDTIKNSCSVCSGILLHVNTVSQKND